MFIWYYSVVLDDNTKIRNVIMVKNVHFHWGDINVFSKVLTWTHFFLFLYPLCDKYLCYTLLFRIKKKEKIQHGRRHSWHYATSIGPFISKKVYIFRVKCSSYTFIWIWNLFAALPPFCTPWHLFSRTLLYGIISFMCINKKALRGNISSI